MAEPSHSSSIIAMPPERRRALAAPPQSSADPWMTAEKRLNYFVGYVALMERVGNCLGTLAFTWATVVVLGGFSTNLGEDFWYATAIVFLEAFRVFSRESRSDDELLFKTTGSIRLKRMKLSRGIPYYLTVSIAIVCVYGTLEFSLRHNAYIHLRHGMQYHVLLLSVLLALASVVQAPQAAEYLKDHAWLQFLSALVAVLALGSAMLWSRIPKREILLIIPPLFVGCFQSIFKEIGACLENLGYSISGWYGSPSTNNWLGTLVSLILPAWIVISVLVEFGTMGVLILLGTLILGNIQVPVAVARIVISVVRLHTKDNSRDTGTGNEHLAAALTVFYSMVLAQGILYLAACVLESLLSSPLRRLLARSCNLNYTKGYDSINLYYEHAFNKRMEQGVLAQEDDMGLVTFALNSLDSNSNDKKLAAVQILYSLLQLQGASNARLVSKITTSIKVVATLINMLGFTASEDDQGTNMRLYAANIIASLAGDLRIAGIPGTIQMVSSLLDVDAKNKDAKQDSLNQLLDKSELFDIEDNQQQSHASAILLDIKEKSKQVEGGNKSERGNIKFNFLECIYNILHGKGEGEEPSKDMDVFVLGMLILERLTHDLDNCIEISKETRLVPKIIGFVINTTDITNNMMTLSLQLIAKLASIEEAGIGTAIRQKILDRPFFLSNLVEILVDNNSHLKQWKLTMVIVAKIILEGEVSRDIELFHVIIPKLMHAFFDLDDSSNSYDRSLRKLVGEALSKLAQKSTSFCVAIMQEKGYGLFGDLKNMLRQDEYTYVVGNLLINLCAHSSDRFLHPRSIEHLSSILRVVLYKISEAEGKELETLIITASKLHNIIPKQFSHELESCTYKEKLVQKLAGALNSNRKMCHESPRMRRVIVEITISIVESCPHYTLIFKNNSMLEALSKVERIIVEVEKYKALLGDTRDVFNTGLPPLDLVIKAKELIGSETLKQEAIVPFIKEMNTT